jgi:6-pyruvoyltetrahydropterin/6-carboxytetrahydropterin synthase
MRISKTFAFDAAHHLPDYPGLCSNVHGHSWQVEVVLIGKKDETTGMVVDFKWMKDVGEEILGLFDHQDLNDFLKNPTAENIATYLYGIWTAMVPRNIIVQEVNVWEQPTSKVSYTHFDWEDLQRDKKFDS